MQQAKAASAAHVPSSQGVDLSLLERLRAFVRYEFDPEATREELMAALRRSHNNLGDAYHWLKEQRRQHQLAVAQSEALRLMEMPRDRGSAIEASACASNGIKRRTQNEGTDELMEVAPSKRQRSLALKTVDLSQEDEEDAEMTQATQTQAVTVRDDEAQWRHTRVGRCNRLQDVDREKAVRILHQIVESLQTASEEEPPQTQWLADLVGAISIPRGPDLEHQLVVVVHALANTLKHVQPDDMRAVKSDGVNQIIDVLLEIPQQNEYEVVMKLSPPDDEFDKYEETVEKSYSLALADELNKYQRAQAARNVITEITNACASCVSRQESIRGSLKQALTYRRCVRQSLHTFEEDTRKKLDQAKRNLESSESEMAEARHERSKQTRALLEVVRLHKDQLLEQGEDKDDAEVFAFKAVFSSTDPDVSQRCRSHEERNLRFESIKQDVIRTNARLEFFQKLVSLLEVVKPRVEQWAELSSSQIECQKSQAEREIAEKLKQYVPKLTHALRLYYDFHTIRQKLASKDRSKQEQLLAEHEEFYADLVPAEKRDIQNKIQQFNGVIVHSTQQMREVACIQSSLWLGKQNIFPREVFAIVENEYGKLWSELSGGARDMMRDCVSTICDYPATAAASTTSISLAANVKVETSLQFAVATTAAEDSPVFCGSSLTPPSPFVDLTLDQDGDDKMDEKSTFEVHIENPSTQFSSHSTNDAGSVVSDAPPAFNKPISAHEFAIGTTLFSRVSSSDGSVEYCRCHVKELHGDGGYTVVFADGDEYPAHREQLLTHDEMLEVKRQDARSVVDDSGKGCTLM